MRKRDVALLCCGLAAALLSGCQKTEKPAAEAKAAEGKKYTIRIGHTLAPTHPYHLGGEKFKELLEAKTNGQATVEVFPNSALGNERDMIEALQLGTLEMTMVSSAPLAGFTSELLVFDLPFIFSDVKTARACVDSDIGQGMLKSLEKQGIMGLVYFENGFRHVTNSRQAIKAPSDMAGMKIRTMENPIHMESFRAMGASPMPMAFGELYQALQNKTIDGQENPLAIIDTSKFYEVQKYLSLTGHFYAPTPVLIAKKYYDSLPANIQTALLEAVKEAQVYQRGLLDDMNTQLTTSLAAAGMAVNEVDKQAFIDAVQSVYQKYTGTGAGQIPEELVQKVRQFKAD